MPGKDPQRFAGKIGVPGSPLPLSWWLPPHGVVRELHGDELAVGAARAGAPAIHADRPPKAKRHPGRRVP